jgi:parvulin-like peptidyl-prolyl isomerase
LLGPATATATPYTFSGYKSQYTAYIKSLKDAGVSEATFRSLYENQIYREKLLALISKDVPHMQEGALIRHILVDSEQLANDLYLQLIRGEDFATLAKIYSKDVGSAADDGNIGWSVQGSLVPEFEQAAFSQKIGEIGKPVKSQYGYHIIQVIAREDCNRRIRRFPSGA